MKFYNDDGSILIYVLFLMSILSLLSIYSLKISLSDNVIAETVETDTRAYYIAGAGMEMARYEFVNGNLDVNEIVIGNLNDGYFEAEVVSMEFVDMTVDEENLTQLINIVSHGFYKDGKYRQENEFVIK